jgi:hypothetical protein
MGERGQGFKDSSGCFLNVSSVLKRIFQSLGFVFSSLEKKFQIEIATSGMCVLGFTFEVVLGCLWVHLAPRTLDSWNPFIIDLTRIIS